MKSLMLIAFLFLSLAQAQSPPAPSVTVGGENQQQPGSVLCSPCAGEQRIGTTCLPADAGTGSIFPSSVKIGGRLWWWTDSQQVGVSPPRFHVTGTTAVVFATIGFASATNFQFPGAGANWDRVLINPSALTLSPMVAQTGLTTGSGGIAIPAGGYDRFWIYWDVPVDPALNGQILESQALRIEPTDLKFYLSNQWLSEIRP